MWELIRKYKKNRTIIMTTNFIEEADTLSDRTAIMNRGEVRCYGSPMFLKNVYGFAYRLTVSKSDTFDQKTLIKLLNDTGSHYVIESNVSSEMKISLKFTDSTKVPKLLNDLEMLKESTGIAGFGISSATLEEAYLK